MADVLRLSCPSSSPLLLTFSSSPNSANRLGFSFKQNVDGSKICLIPEFAGLFPNSRKGSSSFKLRAIVANNDEPKWWERTAGSNMIDIHSTEEFLNALSEAGEKLVIVDFYGTWCGSCRALFPKLCRTAQEHPDIIFLKVNFDANKMMCKRLNVKVLPYFHFYRGSDGQLESFSCSLAKFQKIKDAIAIHNTARCSIGPPRGVGDLNLLDGVPATKDKPAEASNSR